LAATITRSARRLGSTNGCAAVRESDRDRAEACEDAAESRS